MHNIGAVVFDLDGTLYANWKLRLQLLPFALAHVRFMRGFACIRSHIRHIRPIQNLHAQQVSMLAAYLNCNLETARNFIHTLVCERIPDALKHIKPYNGLTALLTWLRERSISTAILSDFPIEQKLKNLNLELYWDVVHCSEDSGYLKPHPQPFKDVCDKLSIPPTQVLFVGDSYRYDILGAHALGMKSAYMHHVCTGNTCATIRFSCYNTLQRWLEHSFCFV